MTVPTDRTWHSVKKIGASCYLLNHSAPSTGTTSTETRSPATSPPGTRDPTKIFRLDELGLGPRPVEPAVETVGLLVFSTSPDRRRARSPTAMDHIRTLGRYR